ncbi:MAG: M1 family metallopeptidase [Flavobacteriaceae bacterium]|nr:M1 family metallopeptidase [Flavobacteriaceae bacterium]
MKKIFFAILSVISLGISAQNNTYWQQHVDYTMEIDMDVEQYQFDGQQKLVYTNNSPDNLNEVFYHLQFNAFQPGSEMDMRLQNIPDPDGRMANNIGTKESPVYESRISKLQPDEIGYQKIISLKQNGQPVKYEVIGTILKVTLNNAIKPGEKSTFDMTFKGQVPVQIRRSGRDNAEGIALSMAQWYPKLAEYDIEGWHANEYIAREFHGVWGDFDVTIHIDKNYTIGGTGYLQNPQEVGHGYEDRSKKLKLPKGDKLTWHFKAPKVHDFTWAADDNYMHDIKQVPNGATLHFLYLDKPQTTENWKKMQEEAVKTMQFFNQTIGDYPYEQYSIIQGGDGGMEYGMCTLMNGDGALKSLIGTMRHEMAHSWFQFVLASNETKHPWMDEGFTSYVGTLANKALSSDKKETFMFDRVYKTYNYLATSGKEEPLTTQADRYNTNMAYSIGSYYKGQIFLSQLGYIIGEENLAKTIKKYYADFKFKHPKPNDIKRTAEKVSGLQLDWYLNEWEQTTHTIDYGVQSVSDKTITLNRIGQMPMPIDLTVTYTDGSTENYYIPLQMMLGKKPTSATTLSFWAWGNPTYAFTANKKVKKVTIDSSLLMADVNRANNIFEAK